MRIICFFMYLFVLLPIEEHLGSFHFGVIMNKAVINIHIQKKKRSSQKKYLSWILKEKEEFTKENEWEQHEEGQRGMKEHVMFGGHQKVFPNWNGTFMMTKLER